MKLWMMQYDCGDYYCEGVHPYGVYESEELASEAGIRWMAEQANTIGKSWFAAPLTVNEDME